MCVFSAINRPKKLLVFINPAGGKKNAPEVYRKAVAPYFDLAGLTVDVVLTTRANHARDMIMQDNDISAYDGWVTCTYLLQQYDYNFNITDDVKSLIKKKFVANQCTCTYITLML